MGSISIITPIVVILLGTALATAIQKQINTNCKIHPVNTAANPTKAERPKYSVLSCEKIKKEFNLNPQSWESALKDCLKKIG